MKNYYVYAGKEFGRGDLKGMYGYEAAKVRMSQTDRLCKNCVCVCVCIVGNLEVNKQFQAKMSIMIRCVF